MGTMITFVIKKQFSGRLVEERKRGTFPQVSASCQLKGLIGII
jgi:hypothetical protein